MATRPASPTTRSQEGGTVLQLEGVDVPVRTRVLGRTESHVTVEQALPFLRLDSRVLEGAERSARIRRVAVGVEHGVPRLIMELSYDHSKEDATIPYELHREDEAKAGAPAMGAPDRIHQRTLAFRLPRRDTHETPPRLSGMLRRTSDTLAAWLAHVWWLLRRLMPNRA